MTVVCEAGKVLTCVLAVVVHAVMDTMKGAVYAACVLSTKEAGEDEEAVTVRR